MRTSQSLLPDGFRENMRLVRARTGLAVEVMNPTAGFSLAATLSMRKG